MKIHPFIYICYPFRGGDGRAMKRNIEKACEFGREAYRNGFIPIIPHINSKAIFGIRGPDKAVTEFDLLLLAECDAMWVCATKLSKGMRREVAFCHRHNIPLVFNLQKVDNLIKEQKRGLKR